MPHNILFRHLSLDISISPSSLRRSAIQSYREDSSTLSDYFLRSGVVTASRFLFRVTLLFYFALFSHIHVGLMYALNFHS